MSYGKKKGSRSVRSPTASASSSRRWSRPLDALERLGLIERVRSTADRRKTHVQLTAAGRTMRDTLHGYASDVLEAALTGISDDEIAVLRRTLQRIKGNLG